MRNPPSNSPPTRRVRISKAMSWLLRHGATKERIAMTPDGYVRVSDLLAWQKMRKELQATFEELLEEVRSNEKQRFALLYVPAQLANAEKGEVVEGEAEVMKAEEEERTEAATAANITHTAHALSIASSQPNPDPSQYLIRATQGHSIKTVSASSYLMPITLDDPSSMLETVVHGTFYAAWDAIRRMGGLRPMSRVHVHFATGPSLESVLSRRDADADANANVKRDDAEAVISGMRSNAQILIYINVRKALEMGVPFWRSENGVVLSEGVGGADGVDATRMKVPLECWDTVVEVKEGLGVLCREGKDVQELPDSLKKMGWPHRKGNRGNGDGGGGGGQGKGRGKGKGTEGKPRLMVERDEVG